MENSNNSLGQKPKIKIERRYGDNYSYFVDANGLLQGEWGGFEELYDKGPNGEAMFEIFLLSLRIFLWNVWGLREKAVTLPAESVILIVNNQTQIY